MKKIIGKYLTNNNYYVGSIDEEKNLIWVSIEASDDFIELALQSDNSNELYFVHDNQKISVNFL